MKNLLLLFIIFSSCAKDPEPIIIEPPNILTVDRVFDYLLTTGQQLGEVVKNDPDHQNMLIYYQHQVHIHKNLLYNLPVCGRWLRNMVVL